MMIDIAVLIPTYGRSKKLNSVVKNFYKYSKISNLYFIIDPEDTESVEWLKTSNQKGFIVSGEYVEAINFGYKNTTEPYIFCGADDIEFTKDWDIKLVKNFEDEDINITGGIDDWICSRAGIHISHPLVRREYIKKIGGCLGQKDAIYYSGYKHYHCDIELEQVAWSRGCIKVDEKVTIKHNHFVNNKVENDATYQRSYQMLRADTELYNLRKKHFEFWLTEGIHSGKKIVSPYRKKRLSIVMPTWNCKNYVDKTIDSLLEKTFHKYEIIVIDDCSSEFDKDYLYEIENKLSQEFLKVTVIRNSEQRFCNYNWNKGVKLATGDYIAVINSDIEFETDEWDDYLIENIDLGYELVNSFQNDRIYNHPYMKPPHEDFLFRLNIRGACYMLSREFADKVFPIPKQLTHWCGDNFISQHARNFMYDIRVVIYHHISKSGEKVPQKDFWLMVQKDVKEYKKLYPSDDISPVENTIRKNIEYYAKPR